MWGEMDQATVDGFLRHYQQLPAEDLSALDQRREELTPEAIAALDQVLKDTAIQAQVTAVADDMRRVIAPKPLGLGGWLWLLIIGFASYGIFSLENLSMVHIFYAGVEADRPELVTSADWQVFKRVIWLPLGLQTIVAFYMAIRLYFRRNRRTIHLVIASIWLLDPIVTMLMLGSIIFILGRADMGRFVAQRLLDAEMANPLRWFVLAALWTLYLLLSKRVKSLYPASPATVT